LCRALALLLLACACSEPPAKSPEASSSSEPESEPSSEGVDLHGEWRRWVDTQELREQALARLESVPRFGLGRRATAEEIARIDIDVMPDGTGLPEGHGTVERGRALYKNQCVQCHGADGRGADYDALTGAGAYTVGNYWPYATTVWDYVNRAMPFDRPGTLRADDVYAAVAYVLHLNRIVCEFNAGERLPRETVASSLRLFCEEVMPAFG